jgi:hypothetical protein
MTEANGFYEDDESAEKIWATFEHGQKGVTKRPRDLNRLAASIVQDATDEGVVMSAVPVPKLADVTFLGGRFNSDFVRLPDTPEVTVTR